MNQAEPLPPVIDGSTSISYNLSRGDVFCNYFTIFIRNRTITAFVAIMLIANLALVFNEPDIRYGPVSDKISAVLLRLALFVGVLLVCQALVGVMIVYTRKDPGLVGRHDLQITDEGLVESTEVNRGVHKWPGIRRIISGPVYLYIYTGTSNFFQVPKREVDPFQLAAFEMELRRRATAAKTA